TADAIHVGHATTAGRCVAAQAMLAVAAIEEAADRLTGNVVHTGLPTGADGDEFFIGLYRAAQGGCRQGCGQYPCQGSAFHGDCSFCSADRVVPGLVGLAGQSKTATAPDWQV